MCMPYLLENFAACKVLFRRVVGGVPGGTRTPDLLLRRQLLYPAELQAHSVHARHLFSRHIAESS